MIAPQDFGVDKKPPVAGKRKTKEKSSAATTAGRKGKNYYRSKEAAVRTHECPECNKMFFSNYDLVRHMHTHTGVRPYPCTVCHKAFTQEPHLRTHMLIHTGRKGVMPFFRVCHYTMQKSIAIDF